MNTAVRVLILASLLAVASATVPPALAAAPEGLQVDGPIASLPPGSPFSEISAVGVDGTTGRVVAAASGRRIVSFTSTGELVREWTIPAADTPDAPLLVDVAPDGAVYAAALGGDTVYRFDSAGTLLGSWTGTGFGRVNGVVSLAADPRGSMLLTDLSSLDNMPAAKRYTPDGRYLGLLRGSGGGRMVITPNGSRWEIEESAVLGIRLSGRPFQMLGRECLAGHNPTPCPSGIGAFGVAPPTAMATSADGALAAVEAGRDRVQFFDPEGRILFACTRLTDRPLTGVAYDSGRGVVLAAGTTLYRARLTAQPTSGCRRAPVRVTRFLPAEPVPRRRHTWRVSYRLSRPAKVRLMFTRVYPIRCATRPDDPFDAHHGCLIRGDGAARRGPGRYGTHHVTVHLPPGRWSMQIEAVDRQSNAAYTPWETASERRPSSQRASRSRLADSGDQQDE